MLKIYSPIHDSNCVVSFEKVSFDKSTMSINSRGICSHERAKMVLKNRSPPMSMNSQDQLFVTKTRFKYCKIVPNSLIFNTKALFKLVIQNQFLKVCCLDNSLCLEYLNF